MRFLTCSVLCICCIHFSAFAELLPLNTALQNTYRACVDIDDDLHDMKVLAGINTAITGVGTGLGIGATATGFVKTSTDKKIADIEALLAEIKEKTKDSPPPQMSNEDINNLRADFEASYSSVVANINNKTSELEELKQKSKKLGNWRTGLLASNTATNIAGAIIANKNRADRDLQPKIDKCIDSLADLNESILAAKVSGEDVTEAKQIYETCRDYEYVDLSPITKRAKGAMISSTVGALTGGIGTVTSAMANSDKVRNDDTEQGKQKEKNLNTASNVLAVGSTVASATATVFNASQISAIKKVAAVAEKCTGVLK